MLEKSDTSISETLKRFNNHFLDVSLLVPTDTAMKKSIMDATASVREYLEQVGYHDYGAQAQGPENKVQRRAFFVRPNTLEEATVSLYRPKTKKGDPRIWFGNLKKYAEPFNLLALIIEGNDLFVVNCSDRAVMESMARADTPLGEIAARARPADNPVAGELLELIREISGRGFIKTLRPGDTGIGMTLETLLGIAANANKAPDFKGIEIKAKRLRKTRANRITLFSQVPDWSLSPIGSAWNLLSTYGYERNGKLRLNHEMNALSPNSIGFILEVDAAKDWLKQNHYDAKADVTKHVTTWEMEKLRERLVEKHKETFWVAAKCRGRGEEEEFHYVQIEHTRQPKVRNFDALIEGGVISVDYLMSQKGEKRVRDHGYLFKMHPTDFEALFPPSKLHVFS